MVHTPVSMISQMCVIDVACYDMLVVVIYKATDNTSQVQLNSTSTIGNNSSSSSTSAHNALVEQDLYMEDMAFVISCWLVNIRNISKHIHNCGIITQSEEQQRYESAAG